jgi:hypothetical protein
LGLRLFFQTEEVVGERNSVLASPSCACGVRRNLFTSYDAEGIQDILEAMTNGFLDQLLLRISLLLNVWQASRNWLLGGVPCRSSRRT